MCNGHLKIKYYLISHATPKIGICSLSRYVQHWSYNSSDEKDSIKATFML